MYTCGNNHSEAFESGEVSFIVKDDYEAKMFNIRDQDGKSPKTEFVELSGNEENKYLVNDSLDTEAIVLDPLRINTCKAENREQDLMNSLEDTIELSAKVKEERIQDEAVKVFEDSKAPVTEFVELSQKKENTYLIGHYMNVGVNDLENPLCVNTRNAECTDYDLASYLEKSQHNAEKQEKTEEEGGIVFRYSEFSKLAKLNEQQEGGIVEISSNNPECQHFLQNMKEKISEIIQPMEKSYECRECRRKFSAKRYLTIHMRIHTNVKPYECQECGGKFSQKSNLNVHLQMHTGLKPYECQKCSRNFSNKYSLNKHMRIHTGLRPYECLDCRRKFSHKCDLDKHMLIHTGLKPYECEVCRRKFSRKSPLIVHMRIHTGLRPYECQECRRKFSAKSRLIVHMRIHTNVKPYECQECGRKFSQKAHLIKHIRIH